VSPADQPSEALQEPMPAELSKGPPPDKGKGVLVKRMLLSMVVALAIIVVLFKITEVSPSLVAKTLRGVSPGWALLCWLGYMFTYVLRGIRFRMLIHSHRVSLRSMFDIVCVHNLLNQMLPMRAGELSYVYLARYRENVPVGEGLGTLIIARVMDLIAFMLVYPIAILVLYLQGFHFPSYIWKILLAAVPVFFMLALLLFLLSFRGRKMLDLFRRVVLKMPFVPSRLVCRVLEKLEESVSSFEQLGSRRLILNTLVISLAIYGVLCVAGYFLLLGLGYYMSIPLVIFCSTLAYLSNILPIHGFCGFGTHEAGWTIGCMMAGFSKEMGMASGFSFHIIILGFATVAGLYGIFRVGIPHSDPPEIVRE